MRERERGANKCERVKVDSVKVALCNLGFIFINRNNITQYIMVISV